MAAEDTAAAAARTLVWFSSTHTLPLDVCVSRHAEVTGFAKKEKVLQIKSSESLLIVFAQSLMFLKAHFKLLGYKINTLQTQSSHKEGDEGLQYCTSGAWGCSPQFRKKRVRLSSRWSSLLWGRKSLSWSTAPLSACFLHVTFFPYSCLGIETTELIPQGKLVLVHSFVTTHLFLRERKRPAMLKPALVLLWLVHLRIVCVWFYSVTHE